MGTGTGGRQGIQPSGPPGGRLPLEPAGFWPRAAAFLVDATLLLLVVGAGLLVLILTPLKEGFLDTVDPARVFSLPVAVTAGLGMVAALLYFSLGESSRDLGTVGKRLLGLHIVDLDGTRIGLPRAAGRFLAKILSCVPLFAGVAVMGMNRKKQALHDLVAGTVVMEYPVTNTRRRLVIGTAAGAACLTSFLAVLALAVTLSWYSMR